MFIAVSILSPVNTHTFIPASFIEYIVSPTFSCKRSSIAVVPIMFSSTSIFSEHASIASSLPCVKREALKNY